MNCLSFCLISFAVVVVVVECKLKKCCSQSKVLQVSTQMCLENRWPEQDFRLGLENGLSGNETSEGILSL